jgi:hypothetical protein
MNKLATLPRLLCLTSLLTAGSALMVTPDIANARGYQQRTGLGQHSNGHHADNAKHYGMRPRYVMNGQPASTKYVPRHHQEQGRQAQCKTSCNTPVQTAAKANSGRPTTASNATLTARPNGTIKAGPGVNMTPRPNRNATVAVKPASETPGGVTIGDDAKAVGTFYASIGAWGAGSVGAVVEATSPATAIKGAIKSNPITGPITESVKAYEDYVTDLGNTISSWW